MMVKLKMFMVKEPVVVAATGLTTGIGLFLPAMVRPLLGAMESSKQVLLPALDDAAAGVTGKKQ